MRNTSVGRWAVNCSNKKAVTMCGAEVAAVSQRATSSSFQMRSRGFEDLSRNPAAASVSTSP
jgi:hypothetical protein